MSEIEDYLVQIEKIIGSEFSDGQIHLDFSCEDYEGARKLLHDFRTMQKELRALKRDINQTIKGIRSEFTTERLMVGKSLGSAFAAGLLGRRAVGSYNAAKRDDLRVERDDAIAPFNALKGIVDDVIHQLDKGKFEIESSETYKNKPSRKVKKPNSAREPKGVSTLQQKSKRYFINLSGDIKGPMAIEQIEGLLAADVVDKATLICVEGEIDWHPLEHFFEVPK